MKKSFLALLLSLPGAFSFPHALQAAEGGSADQLPVELEVRGNRSRHQLERLAFEAERKVYDIFNDLNEENEFDIECHNEYPTGSRIRSINCRPNFVDNLLVEESNATVDEEGNISGSDSLYYGYEEVSPYLRERYESRLRELMTELVLENPGFARAVMEHAEVATQLRALEERE